MRCLMDRESAGWAQWYVDSERRKASKFQLGRLKSALGRLISGPGTHRYARSMVTDCSTTSLLGRSWRPRGTVEILSTTSCPSTTSPKMVCLPVSQVVGATVMKNCEPFVFGPAFAMASLPGLSNLCGDP